MTYLITFACYGCHLHGSESGSVDREHNVRGTPLLEVDLRSNHVHAVVQAEAPPERVMNYFKAYASRRLNQMRLDEPNRKRWARHGSSRFLWKPKHILAAIQYSSLPYFSRMSRMSGNRSLTRAALFDDESHALGKLLNELHADLQLINRHVRQTDPQRIIRPEQQRLHRLRRTAQRMRDLRILQFLILMHDHRSPLTVRQLRNRLPDLLQFHFVNQKLIHGRPFIRYLPLRIALQPRA